MSKYQYKLNCELNINPNVYIAVKKRLEIKLPCVNCKRDNRTIIFEGINEEGFCTPRNKCNGFLGKLISSEVNKEMDKVEISYLIDFEYDFFLDQKYKVMSNFNFGWARISFIIICSKCQKENTVSTQENIGRPWNNKCDCGNVIYSEKVSPFKYEANEVYINRKEN
jgi:hypothetical protein